MKSLFILLLLSPIILFSQNVGIGTSVPGEKLEVNGIIFTSQGGVKFPDGSIQTTAYIPTAAMMDMDLSAIVIEFDQGADIIGPAQGDGISNGINVLAASEGMSSAIIAGQGPAPVNIQNVNFTVFNDANSAQYRGLIIGSTQIPYIEVFYLRMDPSTGNYSINSIARYEECYLTSYSGGKSNGEPRGTSNISFAAVRACYRSYDRDDNGVVTREVNSCYQIPGEPGNCGCDSF